LNRSFCIYKLPVLPPIRLSEASYSISLVNSPVNSLNFRNICLRYFTLFNIRFYNEIWTVFRQLKQQRQSILIVDKNLNTLLSIADRYYLMEKGEVVAQGLAADLASDNAMQARYPGV
jgi:hypothetical protein